MWWRGLRQWIAPAVLVNNIRIQHGAWHWSSERTFTFKLTWTSPVCLSENPISEYFHYSHKLYLTARVNINQLYYYDLNDLSFTLYPRSVRCFVDKYSPCQRANTHFCCTVVIVLRPQTHFSRRRECMWATSHYLYQKLLSFHSLLKLFFIKPNRLPACFLSPQHIQVVLLQRHRKQRIHGFLSLCPLPVVSSSLSWGGRSRVTGSVGVLIFPWSALELDLHQLIMVFDMTDGWGDKGRRNLPWQIVEFSPEQCYTDGNGLGMNDGGELETHGEDGYCS